MNTTSAPQPTSSASGHAAAVCGAGAGDRPELPTVEHPVGSSAGDQDQGAAVRLQAGEPISPLFLRNCRERVARIPMGA
jgi:hypothetical protein